MNYDFVKAYIKSIDGRGIQPGLDNIRHLCNKLHNPENALKFIHIAGTNGKGSVGAYLSYILCENGNTAGRFISPCVGGYENTFLINNNPVDPETVTKSLRTVRNAMDSLATENIFPTSFEAEVALALVIFKEISPDYVLMECGMGGRNDATNIIPAPEIAVITKISTDHTAFLGNSLIEIADEKSGIIKNGAITVTCPQEDEVLEVIKSACNSINSTLVIAEAPEITGLSATTEFSVNGNYYKTKMAGIYQPQNASVAISCAEALNIPHNVIYNGVYKAQWGFRFEIVGKFVLDGAHNPDGARELAKSVNAYFPNEDIAFVFACFKDKDYRKIIEATLRLAREVFCVTAPTERGLDAQIITEEFINMGCIAHSEKSLKNALEKAGKHQRVIVFGTLSILNEAKEIIEGINRNATV